MAAAKAVRDAICVPLTTNEWDLVIDCQLVAPVDGIEMTLARTFAARTALRENPKL
ncbi:hypothetical protein N8071_00320 [bacterium]|nr:hypothetical protein [bacterium]